MTDTPAPKTSFMTMGKIVTLALGSVIVGAAETSWGTPSSTVGPAPRRRSLNRRKASRRVARRGEGTALATLKVPPDGLSSSPRSDSRTRLFSTNATRVVARMGQRCRLGVRATLSTCSAIRPENDLAAASLRPLKKALRTTKKESPGVKSPSALVGGTMQSSGRH